MSTLIVVAAGVIRNSSGEILLVRRAEEQTLSGYWEFPGGKVEAGEAEAECLKRELREELGIEVKVEAFVGQNYHVYDHGWFLLRAFGVLIVGGNIGLSVHDKLAWVKVGELSAYNLAPADIPIALSLGETVN